MAIDVQGWDLTCQELKFHRDVDSAAREGGSHLLLRPLVKPKIIKKRTKTFIRHQSDQYVKIKRNQRKPRGTDSRVHRRLGGQILMPSIDYGSNKEKKHTLPSGFRKFLVHNVKEHDVLLMSHTSHGAETDHSGCHKPTVQRAAQPANPNARLHSEESRQTAYVHIAFGIAKTKRFSPS
uniref:60S ribosomal protein L32 n=1 Tax=Callorhinus ursinus TaxID=34884 RepID=A0A3Q7PUT4_CALUR|nr:60S ribosomal protein L32-like [Callorhinus ursinus]